MAAVVVAAVVEAVEDLPHVAELEAGRRREFRRELPLWWKVQSRPVMMRNKAPQILLVGAVTALALAANLFLFEWALLTESFLRWVMHL